MNSSPLTRQNRPENFQPKVVQLYTELFRVSQAHPIHEGEQANLILQICIGWRRYWEKWRFLARVLPPQTWWSGTTSHNRNILGRWSVVSAGKRHRVAEEWEAQPTNIITRTAEKPIFLPSVRASNQRPRRAIRRSRARCKLHPSTRMRLSLSRKTYRLDFNSLSRSGPDEKICTSKLWDNIGTGFALWCWRCAFGFCGCAGGDYSKGTDTYVTCCILCPTRSYWQYEIVEIRGKAVRAALSLVAGAYKTGLVSYFTHRDLFPSLMKVSFACKHYMQ